MPSALRRTIFLAILTLASPAFAQWYVGAAIGGARASFHGEGQGDQLLDLGFDDAHTSVDDNDTMYRIHAGWRFHRYLALEAAYVDLGRFSVNSDVSPTGTLNASIKTDGGDLSLVGIWPAWERLSLMGRVGAFASRTRASYSGSGSVLVLDGASSQTRRTTQAVYGIGLLYDILPRLALRAEWSRYQHLGNDLTGGEFDANVYSAGIQWRF